MPCVIFNLLAAPGTKLRLSWHSCNGELRRAPLRCYFVVLSLPRCDRDIGPAYGGPEFARDPLSDRRDGTTQHRGGLCQSRDELGRKPTVSIPFLHEPTAVQVLARGQIKHIRVNLSSDWLHDVTSQAVTCGRIDM